jgi:hypothetical protein
MGSDSPSPPPQGQRPSQPRAGMGGILKEKPFHAKFERTGPVPEGEHQEWVTEMYRNKAGSVRTNFQNHDEILDVEGKRIVILLRSGKVALVMPLAMEGTSPVWGFHDYPIIRTEATKILDIECNRVLLSKAREGPNDAGELWVNYDDGIVLKDIKPTPSGNSVWKVTSISLTDPDPAVFNIPEGFTVMDGGSPH